MSSFSIAILLLMIISLISAAKVCPGYGHIHEPKNCTSTCSMINDQCPQGKKCCYLKTKPCGFHCVIPKDNIEKLGKCPTLPTDDPLGSVCDGHFCDVDNDCKGVKKCCSNSCHSQ
ncbi:unnamed protein product, partial [Rotaria sp. Silwood2]